MEKANTPPTPDAKLLADYGDFARWYVDDNLVRLPPPTTTTTTTKPTRKRAAQRPADAAELHGPAAKKPKLTLKGPSQPRRSARNIARASEDIPRDVMEAAEILLSIYAQDQATKVDDTKASQEMTKDDVQIVKQSAALPRESSFDAKPEPTSDDGIKDTTTDAKTTTKGRKPWVGTPTGQGTSKEKPPATIHASKKLLKEPWNCAATDCDTGFTWVKRDGSDGIGRKAISQYFGRNKKQTSNIHPDVWHVYCRKHYQRAKYAIDAMNTVDACRAQVTSLRTQLDRIKLWRPNATFTVQLTKAMLDRMSHWNACMAKTNDDEAQALIAYNKKYPVNNANGKAVNAVEAAFPHDVAAQFKTHCAGNNKNFTDMYEIIEWIHDCIDADIITALPPMEFLINEQKTNEKDVTDPADNYDLWLASRV